MSRSGDVVLFELRIYECSIPQYLLFVEVVYQERLSHLNVFPGFGVGEPIRVKANQGINDWPTLSLLDLTLWLLSQYKSSMITI